MSLRRCAERGVALRAGRADLASYRGNLSLRILDRQEGAFLLGDSAVGSRASVPETGALVGRSPDADLQLVGCSEEAVSRIHFSCEPRLDRWLLTDRSRHGTMVRTKHGEMHLSSGESVALAPNARIVLGGSLGLIAEISTPKVRGNATGHRSAYSVSLPDDLREAAVHLVAAYERGIRGSAALREVLSEELHIGDRMVQLRLKRLVAHPAVAGRLSGEVPDAMSKAAALFSAFPEFRSD